MFTRMAAGMVLLSSGLIALGGGLRENEMIIGGGAAEADGLRISGPSLYFRQGTPGVVVGMVQVPGKAAGYAYILVIKGDEGRKRLARYDGKCDVSGSSANSQGFVEILQNKVAFAYTVKVNTAGKQLPQELLAINGKALDLNKGRVVLIDLSGDQVSWKQVLTDLPKSPVWPTQSDQVESQSTKLLDHLRRGGKEVGTFLK